MNLISHAEWWGDTPTLCPFRLATGLPCPGCGSTRAVAAFCRGDLVAAWQFNPVGLLTVLVGVLAFTHRGFRRQLTAWFRQARTRLGTRGGVAVLTVGYALLWVWNLTRW